MSSVPEPQQFRPGRPSGPWMLALLPVVIAGAAVYLITNHWLHILDALPYLGVVRRGPGTGGRGQSRPGQGRNHHRPRGRA